MSVVDEDDLAPPQILSMASKRVTSFKLGDTIKSVPTRSL
jgi:hypothetical protein